MPLAATSHERASSVSGQRRSTARRANSGWASRRRLNFGLRRRLASREGASRNARPRRRQTIQLGCPDGVVGLQTHGATFQTVRSSSRRRGEAFHPPQSRPSAERTLDAIQPFCRIFPRCRAYSCGVPRHPLVIIDCTVRAAPGSFSRARAANTARQKLGNPFSTSTKKTETSCSRLSSLRFATGPKRSMGHVMGAEKGIFF